jgi:sec-independent protein translocase protein TatA
MNFGIGELIIVLIIVLVLFGASRLPALGKGLGEAIKGFKDGMKTDAPPPPAETKKELPHDAGTGAPK